MTKKKKQEQYPELPIMHDFDREVMITLADQSEVQQEIPLHMDTMLKENLRVLHKTNLIGYVKRIIAGQVHWFIRVNEFGRDMAKTYKKRIRLETWKADWIMRSL